MILTASHVYHLYIARFLLGIAAGAYFVLIPLYVTEISDDRYDIYCFALFLWWSQLIIKNFWHFSVKKPGVFEFIDWISLQCWRSSWIDCFELFKLCSASMDIFNNSNYIYDRVFFLPGNAGLFDAETKKIGLFIFFMPVKFICYFNEFIFLISAITRKRKNH